MLKAAYNQACIHALLCKQGKQELFTCIHVVWFWFFAWTDLTNLYPVGCMTALPAFSNELLSNDYCLVSFRWHAWYVLWT